MKLKTMITLLSLTVGFLAVAQEEEKKEEKPARPAFESQLLIDDQTVIIPTKNTLEWDIQHRFGTIDDGKNLAGLYETSNIRLGFTYSVLDKLNVGFGLTKDRNYYDFNAKYLILQQTRSNKIPVSVAYYGLIGIENSDRAKEIGGFIDQVSYFNQIMFARRFSPNLSLQASFVYSHYNAVVRWNKQVGESYDIFGLNVSGRYKFSGTMAAIFSYQTPLNDHTGTDVSIEPNYTLGLEIATSGHAFQVFVGNYYTLIPQRNLAYNQNELNSSGLLIGFNMTRLWNF